MSTINNCVVKSLLEIPFSRCTFQEKKNIISGGKPKPKLELAKSGKSFTRHFQLSHYEKYEWLTGSEVLNKMFCWPCILFENERGVWNNSGYNDLGNLINAIQRHERSEKHIRAHLQLKSFGQVRIEVELDSHRKLAIEQHNEKVRKNREILKRLIDITCFLGKQEIAFRGHCENEESDNRGNYLELVSLLSDYDSLLESHVQNSTVFSGLSNRIQNDFILSIGSVIMKQIKEEIANTPFVAIMIDETPDVSHKEQLTTVLRYSSNGRVVERFLGFSDVSEDRTAETLAQCVFNTLDEFNCGDKLVAQTYDGAAVMSSQLNGVQAKVKTRCPDALFVHCCAHVLNLVLSKSVNIISECKIFFATVSGLATFFSTSTKRSSLLDKICKKRLPNVAPTRWNYNARLINTVTAYRSELVELFDSIEVNAKSWDSETILAASGFQAKFDDFNFNFLLYSFDEIFSRTEVLFDILQKKDHDIGYCIQKVSEIKKWLQSDLFQHFEFFWDKTIETVGPPKKKRFTNMAADIKLQYSCQLREITDVILMQMTTRFESLEKLKFIELLNPSHFKLFAKTFPEEHMDSLKNSYGKYFDFVRLKNELKVIYSSDDFALKYPHDIHNYIYKLDLTNTLPELYKLASLILTIPTTTASAERSFSALKRIKTYCRNTQQQDRLSALALISIEKGILRKLKQDGVFHNLVIEEFIKKERRLELEYK